MSITQYHISENFYIVLDESDNTVGLGFPHKMSADLVIMVIKDFISNGMFSRPKTRTCDMLLHGKFMRVHKFSFTDKEAVRKYIEERYKTEPAK